MYIASASTTVKFHDFPSGNVVHNYQPGCKVEGPIRSISWSNDGNFLALVPYSGLTEIVSVRGEQLKLVKSIQDVEEASCAVFQNNTKKLLAMGTRSGLVLVYDVKAKATKKRFPRAASAVTHVDFTARDTHCAAACRNGDVLLYSNVSNNLSCTLRVPGSASVTCLRTNKTKRNLILGGSNEGVVVVWDSNVNKSKFSIEAHKAPVTATAFSPVNADLIVSTGSDRQFCFYDIVDNKCIATIAVENSILAVDFSPDGTYFGMAMQNGRVDVYDSRNIQEPAHSFHAHKAAVRNLAFQGAARAGEASTSSLSSESASPRRPEARDSHSARASVGSARTSDVFGMFIQVPSQDAVDTLRSSGNSLEGGDSFMAALGLDKNDSFRHEDVFMDSKIWVERKPSMTEHQTSNSTKVLHDKIGLGDSKQKQATESTPKLITQAMQFKSMQNPMSPILGGNQPGGLSVSDVRAAVGDVVKEELRHALDDVKTDIKYQATHTTYQLKRMLLDFQMAMVKEFIKVENYCNGIKEQLSSESPPNGEADYLLEENEQLKKKVEALEQRIACMSSEAPPPNANV